MTRTKRNRVLYWTFQALSWASTLLPIIIYAIIGYIEGGTKEKIVLSASIVGAIILFAVSALFKYHLRSPVFLVLLGIYAALSEITVALVIVSVCTILDEFVFMPLAKKYKQLLVINVELDRRLDNE